MLFTVPKEFLPKETTYFFLASILVARVRSSATAYANTSVPITTMCILNTDGVAITNQRGAIDSYLIQPSNINRDYESYEFSVGYEANPL